MPGGRPRDDFAEVKTPTPTNDIMQIELNARFDSRFDNHETKSHCSMSSSLINGIRHMIINLSRKIAKPKRMMVFL